MNQLIRFGLWMLDVVIICCVAFVCGLLAFAVGVA